MHCRLNKRPGCV